MNMTEMLEDEITGGIELLTKWKNAMTQHIKTNTITKTIKKVLKQ